MGLRGSNRPTAARKRGKPAALASTDADSPLRFLSDSDSDIERVNQKAGALLDSFLSFKERNDRTSTESDSRSSSVVPAKRPAASTETPAKSVTNNKRDRITPRSPCLARPLSNESVSCSSPPPSFPVVEIVSRARQELAAAQAMERPYTRPGTKLKRVKRRIKKAFSTYTPTSPSQYTASRPSRRNRGPRRYYATPEYCSQGEEVERSASVCETPASSAPLSPALPFELPNWRQRIYHRSPTLTVVKEPLRPTAEGENEHAPYRVWEERNDCEALWAKHANVTSKGVLLHADFCMSELAAVYYFLTGGEKPGIDVCLQDDIIHSCQILYHCDEVTNLVSRLAQLVNVYNALSSYSSNIAEFLLSCRDGETARDIKSDTHLVNICNFLKNTFAVSALVLNNDIYAHLKALLQQVDERKLKALTQDMSQVSILRHRSPEELLAFFTDAKDGRLSTSPSVLRAYPSQSDQHLLRYDIHSVSSHLRARELGYRSYRARSSIRQTLAKSASENWQHCKSWKGASSDVLVLDWSPDGTRFAAGAATYCHPNNMIYNRRNNLVVGDLSTNSLKELPDHQIPRALLDTSQSNDGSGTSESHLYTSISAVAWSNDVNRMYSSSYDRTVKIWDTTNHQDTKCITTLRHPGKVQVMALSRIDNCRLATGSDCDNSFWLWQVEQEHGLSLSTPLEIAIRHNKLMIPTSLAWGLNYYTKDLLAAGMSLTDRADKRGDPPTGGHLALWRIEESGTSLLSITPNSQNVFDISWHPTSVVFAAGIAACGRSKGLGSDIRSMVNIYDPLRSKRDIVSYDCPGLDINDVSFCPFNENFITAGCTDGTTYVWDFRNPNKILHRLQHGLPIRELDSQLTRAQADTGVQLAFWGDESTRFYTGSSDGCVKAWNIMNATEDVFVKDVANIGHEITSGALSPDKTSMVVGDTSGGIHVFSTSTPPDDDKAMRFEYAEDHRTNDLDSGVRAADELIESGQLVRHEQYGPGKGPNYNGPYAAWARPPDAPADQLSSTPLTLQVQVQQLDGLAVNHRPGLDEATRKHVNTQIQLAKFRNKRSSWSIPPSPLQNNRIAEGDST
ncbi:hypothetical protein MauCBS54593_005581 [Microsporum audouinii]